jgi:hypothetical protein
LLSDEDAEKVQEFCNLRRKQPPLHRIRDDVSSGCNHDAAATATRTRRGTFR